MRRAVVIGPALALVVGGVVAGLLASGVLGQDKGTELKLQKQTQAALETSVQATGDANTHPPKEPITVVTSCPDQNSLHPKTGIFAKDPNHGAQNPELGTEVNSATTFASDGRGYSIDAGATRGDPSQGALEVKAIQTDPCAVAAGLVPLYQPQVYQTPFKGGPVTLVAIEGDAVVFQAADGTVGRLDYLTGTFSPSNATPVPTATPAVATAVPTVADTPVAAQ